VPIYEYRCFACKKRTSVFVRSVSSPVTAACEHCGSRKLTRLMSKFAVHGGKIDLDDASSFDIDETDPRAMARWARQMQVESGEELGPEFDDMMSRIEAGEDPDEVMAEGGMDAGDDVDDDF
jgi:putative FmdB family regulatory protein